MDDAILETTGNEDVAMFSASTKGACLRTFFWPPPVQNTFEKPFNGFFYCIQDNEAIDTVKNCRAKWA